MKQTDRKYRTARIADPKPQSTFSYYGGKSKVIGRYAKPTTDSIIEPFGGAAAYAWHHRRLVRSVWVNDIDPVTYSIWAFLQSPDFARWLKELPTAIEPKQEIDTIVPTDAPAGLDALIRAELSRGTQGRRDIPSRATAFGAHYYWPRFAARFRVISREIAGWKITNLDYRQLENPTATWFIDPPYDNPAGRRYRYCDINYAELGEWTQTRRGQVVACENAGATWLPFKPLSDRIGRQVMTTNVGEVYWERI